MTAPQLAQSSFLVNCIWQSTVCIGLGLAGSYLLRHRPARAHQLLLLAIIAAVAVPIMSTVVRDFGWGLLVARPPGSAPLEYTTGLDYDQPNGGVPVESAHTRLSTFEESAAPAVLSAPKTITIPWLAIGIAGWIGATTILLTRLLVTFALGVRLLSRAEPVDRTDIQQAVLLAKTKLGLKSRVRMLWADRVRTVLIWCWARQPILLVPRAAAQTADKLDWTSIICHELAHYKRRDNIAGLLAELAVCIFPWNALLWLAKSRLVRLSEQACDDWVLASGRQADDYAESLLDLRPQKLMAFAPAVVSSKNGLAGRIRRILQAKCPNPRTGLLWALTVTVLVGFIGGGIAFAQRRPARDDSPQAPPLIKCSGKLIDRYGRSLAAANVIAYKILSDGIAGNIQLIEIGRLMTDSSGAFSFETEPKPEKPTAVFNAVIVAEKQGLALDWASWDMVTDAKVQIELGGPEKLEGTIVDERGQPVRDAEVRVCLYRRQDGITKDWLPGIHPLQSLGATSDDDGLFRFNNLPKDTEVDLLVTSAGKATIFTYEQGPPPAFEGGEGPMFRPGRTDVKIILRPEARIEGKLVERDNGRPVPEAEFAVVATFSAAFFDRFTCVSDKDGSFSIGGLQSGEYLLRTKPIQGEAPRMNVTVESGKTTSDVIFELPPGAAAWLARSAPAGISPTGSEPNLIGPRITFESETHDFGQVPPASKNTCEFKFKNTGDAMLTIGKIQTTCGCTLASLTKSRPDQEGYQPGESGAIAITYTASKQPGRAAKHIHVPTNDKTRPKVSLAVKATVVLHVNPEPDELKLLLNRENAACPNITLSSIDGEPFAIKSISAPGDWLTPDFDPSVRAAKFVLEPKVDMEKLKSHQHGFVKIAVTHPKCDTVQIPYNVLPRFTLKPRSIFLRDVVSGEPIKKQLSIISNYDEDFEVESVSCENDAVTKLSEHSIEKGRQLEIEIIPPPVTDKIFFRDVLYINIKDREQLKIDVRAFYKNPEKTRPTGKRR